MNSHSRELKDLFYIGAYKRFNEKLSEYLEPLMDLFSPRTPIRALPPKGTEIPVILTTEEEADVEAKADVVITPPLTPGIVVEEETEAGVEVLPSSETAIAIVSRIKQTVEAEDSSFKLIPLALNTLQELKQENESVRTRLDKQDEMYKE